MIVTISVQSDELGDIKVTRDEVESRNPEKQLIRLLEEQAIKVRRAYDVQDPF